MNANEAALRVSKFGQLNYACSVSDNGATNKP